MKKTILVLSLLGIGLAVQAQSKMMREIKEKFWSPTDPYKNVVDIPEKWANESAVIIYQEYNYQYEGTTRSVDYSESTRKRIKLLDKSSVEYYSEFSFAEKFEVTKGFRSKGGQVFAGVKVIKSNGQEKEIDLDDAVDVKNDSRETLKKIAVPDLEVGDIIDYYYYIYEPFKVTAEYIFEPIITTMSGEYPIMEQKLEFKVGRDFFINFKSLHGAPELEVTDDNSRKTTTYSLIDKDRKKRKDQRWFFARRVLPIVKFQVIYARNNWIKRNVQAFIGEKDEVKTSVSKDEVLSFFKGHFPFNSDIKPLKKHLKKNKKNSEAENIREAYYYLRHRELISKIEPLMFYQEGYVPTLPLGFGGFMTEEGFIDKLGTLLQSKLIDFDLIVAVPRTISNLDELLLRAEISLMLRINFSEPMYISMFGFHTNPGKIPSELEGTDAYVLELDSRGEAESISVLELPISDHLENRTETITEVSFSDDLKTLNLERSVTHTGFNKARPQSDLLNYYDFIDDDNSYFGTSPYIEQALVRKNDRDVLREKLVVKRAEDKEKQKERFESNAGSDLDLTIESYDSYEIKKMGRLPNDDQFEYQESFKLEELVNRAGNNMIFEAGKLIGGQVALKEDEMEREDDLFMPYARSYKNVVKITIPEGYTVVGLENMEKKVENETGGFVSTAKLDGQKLTIETNKYYLNIFEKAEKWPQMVAFLEAAYKFTQEKLLLKKQ